MLGTFNTVLEKLIDLVLLGLLLFFLSLVSYQIVSRNFPIFPTIYWTEEFSRFSFQWMVLLGTALGVYRSDHFVLDAFPKHSFMGRLTRILREIVLMGIAVFFIVKGFEFAETGWRRRSTAAGLPMFYVYVTFFVGGIIMMTFQAQRLLILLTKGIDRLEAELNAQPPENVAVQDHTPTNNSDKGA